MAISAFDLWTDALATTAPLSASAKPFQMPSTPASLDPSAMPFCPAAKESTTIKSSSPAKDENEGSTVAARAGWKKQGAKGAKRRGAPGGAEAREAAGKLVPRSQRSHAVAPPTPPRRRPAVTKPAVTKPAVTAKKEGHLAKHIEDLQAMPLVRSGLSDLLDGMALPPVLPAR